MCFLPHPSHGSYTDTFRYDSAEEKEKAKNAAAGLTDLRNT